MYDRKTFATTGSELLQDAMIDERPRVHSFPLKNQEAQCITILNSHFAFLSFTFDLVHRKVALVTCQYVMDVSINQIYIVK